MAQSGRTNLVAFRLHATTRRHLEEIRYALRLSSDTEALEVAAILARDFAKNAGIALYALTPHQAINQAADIVGTGKGRHGNAYWQGGSEVETIGKGGKPAQADIDIAAELNKTLAKYDEKPVTEKKDKPRRKK